MIRIIGTSILKNKTGDISDRNNYNYRPISLATILAKVFDDVLDMDLSKHLQLHHNQFGFRPKLSTESAILCLKDTVNYYISRQTEVFACVLDLF